MHIRRSVRSRKARESKQRRSSLFFRNSSFFSETVAPERRRALFIEPLEDRRVLAVTSVFDAGTGALALTFDGANNDAITIQSQSTGTSDFDVNAAAGTTYTDLSGNNGVFTGVTSITVNGNTASSNSLTFDTNNQTNSVSGAISINDIDAVKLNDSNAAPTGTLTAGLFSESGGSNATTTLDRPLYTTGAAGVSITGDKNITANSTLDASAAATGTITLNADNNITVNSGASIKTAGGVSLTAASFNVDSGASVSSSGSNITIAADQMTIQGAIDASSHIVTLRPKTNNTAIDLGGPDAAGTLGLTNAELAEVTAGILRIGSNAVSANSDITLTSPISDAGAGWNTLSLLTNSGVSATISQNSGSSLTVTNLKVFAAAVVNLNNPGNAVSQISGVASGNLSFADSTSLTVGNVDPGTGFAGLGSLYGGTVSLTLLGTGDLLTISNAIEMTQAGNSGNVVLSADDMAINAAIKAPGKAVTLQQGGTTSRDIDLGGGTTAGDLGISDAELGQITASSVTIGRSDNPGSIVVTAPVTTHAGYSDLTLKSGGDISVNYDLTTSGNLSLNAAGTTSIAASVSASATPTVTGGSLFVDYANGASLPNGLAFTTSTGGATLTVSDLGDATGHTYDVTNASFTRDGASPITYSGIANFVLDGGDGGNTITESSGLTATTYTINSGAGDDNITVDINHTFTTTNVNGQGGKDLLTVDYEGFNGSLPASIVNYNAGNNAGDALSLINVATSSPAEDVDFVINADNAGQHNGSIYTNLAGTGGTGNNVVNYIGTKPVSVTGDLANVFVHLPTGVVNPDVAIGAGAVAGETEISGSTFEATTFSNPTNSLTVDLGDQGDTIAVHDMDAAFAPAGASPFVINGGAGGDTYNVQSAQDVGGGSYGSLNIAAGSGNDVFNVSSDAPANAGNLSAIVSTLNIDGGAGSNTLNVSESSSSSSDTVLVTSSQIASAITPFTINYSATGGTFGGGVNLSTGSADDTINVQSTLAGGTTTINTGDGNDTFNVNGPLSGAVSILAGSQTTADVLNYDAGGNSVVLTANSITAGAGQTLTFAGIEDVNITNVAGVTVNGDGSANTLTLARTGATTDVYQLDGGPVVSLDGATSFSFVGAGGADHMQIDETASGLPQFGGAAAGSHTNGPFGSSGLTPTNLGINFSGGGNAGDSLGINFLTSQNVTYFDDNVAAAHSGVVNVAGQFSLSFDGLAPVTFTGAGGTLTVNTLADPTNNSLVVADDGTPGDGVSQITGNGGFETTTFSGYDNLVVQGLNAGGESITLAGLDSATTLSNVTLQGGAGGDIVTVQSLPASVAAALLGGGGANSFVLDNAAHNLQQIAGPVVVSPAGDIGGAGNSLMINDSGDAVSRTIQVTSSTIEGITGDAGSPDIAYGAGSLMSSVSILGGGGGNTFDVQSTQAGTTYHVSTGAGSDTVNVSSDAPTNAGDLSGIQGQVQLDTGIGTDALKISDLGGAASGIYSVTKQIGGATLVAATGTAGILYDAGGAGQLENFQLVGSSVGGNAYNINNTTATVSNVVSDGASGASGNSTFNIQADQLQGGASNTFNGFDGDDTFNLNFAAGASVPSAAGTTLSIDGGGLATGNDRVNVNANQAGDGPRTIGLNYQSNSTSDVQIAGLGTAAGAIGVVGARQINYYGDAANDDTVSVSGAASGNNTLSVTPLSASSANVFLGGNPLLTIPPGSTGSNNPGVAGTPSGAGPDMFVGGVALAGFSVNGGSTGAGNGNLLVVNGKSEDLNGAGATSAWGGNAFGSPADTVTAGNGYDQIDVSDSAVSIVNNAVGALLTVNYAANSFENPSPTRAAVTVNSGDESTPGAGVADDITVHLSPVIHFQINGGTPPTGTAPNGDRLNVLTPNDAEIWSDNATPPNVSIASSGALPVSYNSIEELSLTPGNGIVNIYGDNNVPGGAQNDGYRVVGTGPNAFTLQISGNKTDPASYSDPIQVNGVTTLNAYGEAKGVQNTGSDVNALYVTPWANNTPQGWGVETYWDQGDSSHDGDLLVYNGVSGVSENINVQPSGSQAGQLFSMNAASGTPIAVINYTLNTDIVVNGNNGSAGDTDTLTLGGTDPANPGSSGLDNFIANFAAAGTPADPMLKVSDQNGGAALYTLDNFTNINTLNVNMLGGSDFFDLVSGRKDGSLTVNVDGGAPSGPGNVLNTDSVRIDGTAGIDSFQVSPGASNDAGRITAQLAGATAPTVLNFTTMENVALAGGGGGADDVTLDGTGSNNSFALANGTAQVDSNAPILLSGFGAGSSLNLNGLGGTNSFAIDQATGGSFTNVNINGGPAGDSAAAITGTTGDDAIAFTPFSASSGQIAVTSGGTTNYNLTGVTAASIDALGQVTADSLTTTTAGTYVNTPGSQPGSGTVQVTLPGNIATLPLSYANVENVSFSGTTLVVNGTSGNDNVVVAADGSVTVNGNSVGAAGFNALVLNLNGGTDNVSIAASANFSGGIIVNGAGQTSVTVTGTAGDDTIGVNAAAGTVSGIVAGPITLVGVQNLTVDGGGAAAGDAISVTNLGAPGGLQSINVAGNAAAGDTLQVSGSGGADNMLVTPTGAASGTLQDSGVGAVVAYNNFSAAGALQVTANALTVNGSAADDNVTVTNGRVTVAGDLPVNYNTSASALNIMGHGGGDSLTVDSTTGAVTTPIYYDGGAGSNSLTLTGGTATSDIYSPGAATGQGLSTLVIGGQTESVHFVNLAPVIDNVAGPLVVNGTNGDDAINYSADPNNAGNGLVSVNNLETISFVNKTTLAINGGAGSDTINLNNSNPIAPTGLTGIIVNGGDPTSGGDTLIANGTTGADAINYQVTSATSSQITGAGPVQITGNDVEHVFLNGRGGGDALTVTSIGGFDRVTLDPGAAVDSGDVRFTSTIPPVSGIPLSYSGLGSGGSISFADGGGGRADTLVYNGTAANDTFGVAAGGAITLNSQLVVNTPGVSNLVLNGLGGDNSYDISASQPYTAITVNGSGNSDPDVLNLAGDGSLVTVSLGGTTETVSGGGLGTVDITGVGVVNLNNGAGEIDVLGATGPDNFSVTPTGGTTATIQDGALAPVLNTTNSGMLSIQGAAGDGDAVTVHGTGAADTIAVGETALTTAVQVGGWKPISIDSASVAALVVDGGLGADVFNVSGSGGPALTVEGGQTPAADTLNLAAINATVTYGTDPSSGAIDPGLTPNDVIHFSGLQTISLTGNDLGSLVVNGTSGDDAIQQLGGQVTVNNGATIAFGGYAALTLDGVAGDDHFLVSPTTLPANVSTFKVNGGVSTSGDSLTVNGTSAQDQINFLPTAADQGSVNVNAATPVDFTAIGNVSINGQGGNDQLQVTTPAGADAITYNAGATVDAASVQVGSLVPMSFSNLGATGRVSLADASGNPVDSLLYNGTAGNDSFGVNATGIVYLNNQLPVSIPGIADLTLDGQGGVNTFSVAGNVAIPVAVNGGSASAGNSLTVLGDGNAPLTVDLGNHTIQEAGFGLVSFNGLSQVIVDAAGQNIDVVGGAGDDNLSYTPTAADAGTLQAAGSSTVFSLTGVGNLSLDMLGGANSVTVNGTANADTITALPSGANTTVQVGGLLTVALVNADTQGLVVNGGLGNDTLSVNSTGSTDPVAIPITYDGGADKNALILRGTATSDAYAPGAQLGSGANTIVYAGGTEEVNFVNLSPIFDFVVAPLVVNGTNADNAINYSVGFNSLANFLSNTTSATWGQVSVDGYEPIEFINKSTLTINGLAGSDTINLNNPNTPTGLSTINVDGGDPTASDKLIVNGTSGVDAIDFAPISADAGSVSIAGSPTVNFTTTESVAINGQGGTDDLTYTTPAALSPSVLTFDPGATVNSGSVHGRLGTVPAGSGSALVALSYSNIDKNGTLTFANASGRAVDTLYVDGTTGDDNFNVNGASINLTKQSASTSSATALNIAANGINSLTLSGQGGNDTFNLSNTSNYAGVFVQGNGTVDPSLTNLMGDGSAINVDVGGVSTIVTGGGLGTVTITGNQIVNLSAAGGAVTATDSAGSNTLDVTPTDTNAATLQVEGQAPVVNLTSSGTFDVNFTGAGDSLVVGGTTGPDTIAASGSQVAVNALLTVNYAGATALTVNGSTGSDTFNVTPDANVAIHVNGGDPIGVLPGDTLNIVAGGDPVSFFAGPHSDEGGFQVGSNAAVSFQQIESIGPIVGPGPVLILGTNGDDDIQVIARDHTYDPTYAGPGTLDGKQDFTVSVNAGPNLLFIDAPKLYIDSLSGDDEVDVRAPAPTAGDPSWDTQVWVAGGAPAGQASLNGDNFTLETPNAGNQVTYQPNAIDGGVFNLTQNGDSANSSTITLTSAPFTIPAINYTSSAGGFESATYDGQGGGAALTVMGTTGDDTITHTAGGANDAGALGVNSLLPLSYKNLGATGTLMVDGNGGTDTLAVDGSANNDAFTVDATTGTVHMNNRTPIDQTGIANLVLNGYNPNNTFNLNASLPYANTTVNSIDPATLNLNGTAGAEAIGVDLTNSQITGFGGVVNYVGVAQVNMNGNGGADSLTVTGTPNDDVITYKPTSSGGGTFSQNGVPVTFNFNIGAGNAFTVNGGGGNGGDEVHVLGNNAGSVITVDSPNRTVTVENALNTVLMPVVLGADVQVASVAGGIGNNTFLVIPARNVPPANDTVGPGFQMPNNLLVHVDGGAVPSKAALVVADTNGATLDSSMFAVVNRTSNTSGVVRMFQSTGGPEPIQYPDISYANVGIVQASTAVNAATHQQQTLTMGPDTYDPNGSLNNAAYLGSGASINATNLTIFPNAFEHRFLQAEQDWFRVVAQYTGTMDFQVYFKQYAGFLPGGGELQIQVYDAAGNQIADFGVNDTDSDQRRRIPVVAGETYYLQVYGITQDPNYQPADGFDPTNATVNAYSLSITNTPAPKPDSLGLNNIVAQGSVNNAIAPTTTTFTASDAAVPPPPTQPLPPLSLIDNFYVGKYLEFTSGSLVGQRQQVAAYVGATHTFTFASPFSAAPGLGDTFQIESNDTGRTQLDNVTRDNTPTIYIRLDAANTPTDGLIDLQGGGSTSQTPPNNTPIPIPFWAGSAATPPNSPDNNGSFRVAVYDNTNPQSPIFLGYADAVAGQQGVFQLQVTTPLADGSHILAAKVEIDSPSAPSNKDLSAAATFQMVVDTQAPPVYFGSPTVNNSGLLGSSDTGVSGQPATIADRITADSTPTLYGVAEADAVVRLYDDVNHDGVVDNGDIFLGMTTATPVDGTNQFPSGQWQITSSVDLNNPKFGFPLDGVRHLLVTAEDVAGNVSAPQSLNIFLDTQGPSVKNVSVTGSPGFNLFADKPSTPSPTPLVNSLDITFNDQPIRVGPNFVYPAVNPILATTPGNYQLIGEATGRVTITSITFSDSTASGTPGMSVATLHFAAPLPDDRYTLTISDSITDNAGNKLDGEFGPTFPSGNGKSGGKFLGQFTVDSRPELATYSSGSVSVDLNGNFVFDPQNPDATNRDAVFTMGFSTDRLFAGKFADASGVVNGFDKLGAYGFLNGQWRWLLDLNGDGAFNPASGDMSVVEPLAIDGLPVAGNWTNSPSHADQIGLFDGHTWWLDMNGDHVIDNTDIAMGGELTGDMQGLPIVGDFDGDGKVDLGTYSNGVFYFDLSSRDPGGKLTGNYNATINVQTELPNNIGFAGVLARPVAADMNQDGTTDIGLFVPGRTQNASPSTAEWYWLISNAPAGATPTANFNSLNHPFDPTPLGHDLFAQFGSQFALPLVGNFDPPASGASGGNGGSTGSQSSSGWIQNLYLDVLGRTASSDEIAYWTNAVNHGITPSQIATTFLTSTEHRSQLINTLYQEYLGRQADQAGIDYWIGVWEATGGPEAVQAGIIGSQEYYEKAGGTDTGWVTALYQNILHRSVDAQGLAYWTDFIKTHSKESVVLGFVTSDEYRLGLINGWFQVYLGRKLDATGSQFWLNAMKNGMTQEQIEAGILGSQEFLNR